LTSEEAAVLQTVLAAIVRIQEALEDDDTDLAYEVAEGAELDLAVYLDGEPT
jgi:hypothetical protein